MSGHRSSDGCWIDGPPGPDCGCQSCRQGVRPAARPEEPWKLGFCVICGVADIPVRTMRHPSDTVCLVCGRIVGEDGASRPVTLVDLSVAVRLILDKLGAPQ